MGEDSTLPIQLGVFIISLWISFDDFRCQKIFHLPLFILMVFGITQIEWGNMFALSLLISVGTSLILYFAFPHKIGGGDLKLLIVSSFFLSPFQIALFLILTGLLGIWVHTYYRKAYNRKRFPLAPAILSSLNFCILFPEKTTFFTFVIS